MVIGLEEDESIDFVLHSYVGLAAFARRTFHIAHIEDAWLESVL